MPLQRPVPALLSLSLAGVVDQVRLCSDLVTSRSYRIVTEPGAGDAAERRAGQYIDRVVEGLRAHLFSLVPWCHYQALVDLFMAWLTKAVHQSKAIYRRSNSPPETVHHAHVLVRFVHLVVHPRLRMLDLSALPKVLRDALYRQLSHLTGLQRLHLGSGSGEALRQHGFTALRSLGSLASLSLGSDCTNDTLAVVGQVRGLGPSSAPTCPELLGAEAPGHLLQRWGDGAGDLLAPSLQAAGGAQSVPGAEP